MIIDEIKPTILVLWVGIGIVIGLMIAMFVVSGCPSGRDLFCVGEFGHNTTTTKISNSYYCVVDSVNGVMLHEIILVDTEWKLVKNRGVCLNGKDF